MGLTGAFTCKHRIYVLQPVIPAQTFPAFNLLEPHLGIALLQVLKAIYSIQITI